ncbi:MAG: cation-transporting P-type ATPase, partial [Deltaproteobacteria bacterium]|nr:cation-transporting P-type ATPase [Deltaproteobacteria bacterium]
THEIERRRAQAGPTELPPAPSPTLAELLLRQARSFVVRLLATAAALSFALGKRSDGLAILAALLLNALVGFLMDFRAERAFASLRALAAPSARVRRGGQQAQVPAVELVPGDVVLLAAGDLVPADGRLVEGSALIDESLLTGESVPAAKQPEPIEAEHPALAERTNETFAGTLVITGAGVMAVTSTGSATEVGHIGKLLSGATAHDSPLGKRLDLLGRSVLWMVLVLAGVLVSVGLVQQRPAIPLLETAIALAIAAIPEGLPAVATLALAAGAWRLARQGVLLRRLSALEALGSVTTLCLDKTGTLTANAMTVRALALKGREIEVTGEGWEPSGELRENGLKLDVESAAAVQELLHAAQMCNDATLERDERLGWHIHGDPTEAALLVVAAKGGRPDPRPTASRLFARPPGPGQPWMVVVASQQGSPEGPMAYAKGAPEFLLARCQAGVSGAVLDQDRSLASRALRILGVARKELSPSWTPGDLESGWTWLGLAAMADPPRPGVSAVLEQTRRAGIRPVMITGDQPATAQAIAWELRLSGERRPRVVTGVEELSADADVYARATPAGKLALVQALESAGQLVAMTGDGVNDAPALRAATVGVAMGRGSEVAKSASDAVLTDERLSALLAGVREGRTAFLNIQKAVDYLLTCSVATQLAVLVTTAAGLPLPLLPLQILYLNLLTHTFPALGLTLEPAEAEVLERPPLPPTATLLPSARVATLLWHGLIIAIAAIAVGAWGLTHATEAHARTLVFATLATSLMLHTASDRSARPFGGWRWGRNPALVGFMATAVALQLGAIYLPPLARVLRMTGLDSADWLWVVAASAASLVAVEVSKWAIPPEAE